MDKKGKNPFEKGIVNPICLKQRKNERRDETTSLKKKSPIPFMGIEDCTRLTWSSSRRPGVHAPHPSSLQAGLLALGSSYSRRLPGGFHLQWPSAGFVPNYSGGTAMVLHRLPF
jgi:hypothetical protein